MRAAPELIGAAAPSVGVGANRLCGSEAPAGAASAAALLLSAVAQLLEQSVHLAVDWRLGEYRGVAQHAIVQCPLSLLVTRTKFIINSAPNTSRVKK